MAQSQRSEVFSWFRQTTSAVRIDTLVNLATMCHPVELRFLAGVIEFQLRKDTDNLRTSVDRGNDPNFMGQLKNLSEQRTRNSLVVHLALMHPTNSAVATVVFPALEFLQHSALPSDKEEKEELSLLLAIACAHPAFNFSQHKTLMEVRRVVDHKLTSKSPKAAHNHAVEIINEDLACTSQETILPSRCEENLVEPAEPLVADRSSQTNSFPTTSAPVCSQCRRAGLISSPNSHDRIVTNNVDIDCNDSANVALLKDIEVKGSQTNPDKDDVEFVFKIQWSDQQQTEVCKTYKQLVHLDKMLCKLVEKHNEAVADSSDLFTSPHFPSLMFTPAPDQMPQCTLRISEYLKSVFALPFELSASKDVREFFIDRLVSAESSYCLSSLFESPSRGSLSRQITPESEDSNDYENGCLKSLTIYNTNSSIASPNSLNEVGGLASR